MRPAAVLLALFVAAPLRAQDPAARPLELERRGEYAAAAVEWRGILAVRPGDLPALLGLERALTPLGRLGEMTDAVQAALARESSPGSLAVAVRVWTAARQPDSARAAVERWSRLEPTSEMPFQEWGIAAYGARDRASARAAYLLGRSRLGRPDAMAAELGQIAVAESDWGAAAREWTAAVRRVAGYRGAALSALGQLLGPARETVLQELGRQGEPVAERLAASLMVRWGDPLGGARRLVASLGSSPAAVDALQELAEELRGRSAGESAVARALVLEQLSERVTGADRARVRLDAAQAYADGGDQSAARRMLAALAADPAATPAMAASVNSTLISVLVEEGGIEEADRRFRELAPLLGADDRQRLSLRLAEGWIRGGRLARAESLLVADSSVEALAVRGRVALFQGDLARARQQLAEAGPFTGERASATDRIAILGLLQVIEADSLPELGQAFHRLATGDSTGAAAGFEAVSGTLPPEQGGAELLLIAGRVRHGLGQLDPAERLFRKAVAMAVPAASAAAEYALADLLVRSGRREQAVTALEHLLVAWPTSAVAPQARRLLDVARGVIPI